MCYEHFWKLTGRRLLCSLLAVAAGLTAGCSAPGRARDDVRVFEATGESVLEREGEARVALWGWESYVESKGEGMPAPGTSTVLQKRLTAVEAARCRALAGLVEELGGLEVERESRVLNLQFAAETVEARSAGQLWGIETVAEEFDEEADIAEVTLRIYLDSEGKIVNRTLLPPSPESASARRARAEHAARVDALAKLREQVGEVKVGQSVTVRNLMLSRHEAWLTVEGMLEGAAFAPPEWVGEDRCRVKATLRVPEATLAKLEGQARVRQKAQRPD